MKRKSKILCLLLIIITAFPFILKSQSSSNQKIRTVVIDPGHGGRDPGAVGRFSYEKDLVLAIALKTKEYINNSYNDVEVILTRNDDTFLGLFERAEIANKHQADLFISLHINAATNRQARGTETFVMGLHRSASNLEVAKKENAAILKEENFEERYMGFDPNDPESHIIFSLFQNAHLNQSLFLAQLIQDNFGEKLPLINRGVKQAGFLVLWQTTMPSVLIEAGFISNREEEEYINTPEAQDKIAKSIYKAFSTYKRYYEDEDFDIEDKQVTMEITEEHSAPAKHEEPIVLDDEKETPQIVDDLTEAVEHAFNNPNNETVVTNKIIFKVQIVTSSVKKELVPGNFKSHENVEVYFLDNIYRYTIGADSDFATINNLRKELAKDFPDCFVVAFKNGERIPLNEARRIISNQ